MKISNFKPVVDKKVLVFLAGLMWCGVGAMLVRFAVTWLSAFHGKMVFYSAGALMAMPIHHFGFLKIANKNLNRLMPLTEKKCVFSFMTGRSYIIVLVMVIMGITLRHSGVPKNYLSILYLGIGLALFLSGLRYFRFFIILLKHKNQK